MGNHFVICGLLALPRSKNKQMKVSEKDKLLDTLHPEKDMKEPMAEITNLASEKARLLFSV